MKETANIPVCKTAEDCDVHDGARVDVVGVYTVYSTGRKRKLDDTSPRPVRLTLGEAAGPFLEPFWHKDAVRPAAEVERMEGKRVRVRGIFHRQQPAHPSGQTMATMGGACLHPVEKIELAE